MLQSHRSTLPPTTVAAILARRTQLPRLFLIEWNNRKVRTRDPCKVNKHEAWGTCYPNGLITLDNGRSFESLSEMEHLMELHGSYEIHWLDEEESEETPEVPHA